MDEKDILKQINQIMEEVKLDDCEPMFAIISPKVQVFLVEDEEQKDTTA